jgi:hypothetical protein
MVLSSLMNLNGKSAIIIKGFITSRRAGGNVSREGRRSSSSNRPVHFDAYYSMFFSACLPPKTDLSRAKKAFFVPLRRSGKKERKRFSGMGGQRFFPILIFLLRVKSKQMGNAGVSPQTPPGY